MNMPPTQKIIGEPFFGKLPKNSLLLESDFVRLDKSMIWKLSEYFWKYYSLWEKIYNENFEQSLPSGVSESHKEEFILASARRFIQHATTLQKKGALSHNVYVYEQGPGTGVFAKGFLDELQKSAPWLYDQTVYLLSDSSEEIIKTCAQILSGHRRHTKLYMQDAFEYSEKFKGKILFARMSNLWDGWPCRFIQVRKSGLGEVYVRAISVKKFEKFATDIQQKGFEYAIIHNSIQWKEFFRSIRLETRTLPCSRMDIASNGYLNKLQQKTYEQAGRNTLLSDDIIKNLSFLNNLIDWENNGYIEVVDVIAQEPRNIYPKKYDGSIGYIIDGDIIRNWCEAMNKNYSFKKIRKLNTLLTITQAEKTLADMVHDASLEIFPAKNLLKDVEVLEKNEALAVTCTSKLGIECTLDMTIALLKKGYNAYPHLPARLVKDEEHVRQIVATLTAHTMSKIFVAAGNPPHPLGDYTSAMDLLHAVKKNGFPFMEVMVAGYPEGHPQISQEQLFNALKEKQEFAEKNDIAMKIITQFCFDAATIVGWAHDMKNRGITLPIIVGIPGPCNGIKLLEFAIKCGVGDSLQFLKHKKHLGKEITSHITFEYTPDALLQKIVQHPTYRQTNIVGFHFYTFNNLPQFALWQKKFLDRLSVAKE